MSRSGSGIIEQTNMPIVYLLAHVFGTSPSRLHVEGELPEGNFDLIVRLPKTEDIADLRTRTREQAKAAVLQAFGLTAKQVSRERDVLVLEVPSGKKTKLTATDSSPGMMMCGGGQYKASSATTTNLADCLERMLDEPVVDATGLAGSYSFDLAFSPRGEVEPSEAQVAKALGEQAGLALVKGKREIDVVIVQVAGTPPHPQEGGDR